MSSLHPSSRSPPAVIVTPPIPNNIDEGHHDLETGVLPSGDAEPAAAPTTDFGASTPPHQASRRRGYTQQANRRLHGPVLKCISSLACHTGAGGGGFASDSDFTGNANREGGTAQAPHVVDGEAHITIDVTALRQAAALAPEPTETESVSVTNRELGTMLSSFFRCVDGGPTRYIFTVRGADNVGGEPNRASLQHSSAMYAKVLLSLFGVCLSACSAAFPVIKQAAPDGYVMLAYSLLVVLALVLLTGLLATSFDKSPSSVVWGKYALQLALGLTIGFLAWSVCSLIPTREFSVPIGVAGALVYISVIVLFKYRNW